MKKMLLVVSHGLVLLLGFAAGIYLLPILTQPPAPAQQQIDKVASEARFSGQFRRDLEGSDPLHFAEGSIYFSDSQIAFAGTVAPGPDYRLYLSPVFVETKADFLSHQHHMRQVGEVDRFKDFVLPLAASVDLEDYNSVIIWCESFSLFISAAKYQ